MYVRNKQWLRLSLLRRQSDHTEGEVPVDRCQLQVGVHTAPSHWYSLWPGLSCCRFSTGSFGLNGSRECMFGTNIGCDCHFSGDNLIIQKERFLLIVVSYRLVFTRLLLTGTLCGLVCRIVRFSTGSFGLNGSRDCLSGDDCTQSRVFEYMSSNGP